MAVKRPAPKKKAPVANPYAQQVQAEATDKFLPEQTALRQAYQDAMAQRDQEIASASAAAAGGVRAAQNAIPSVQQASTDANSQISNALSRVGLADDPDVALTRSILASRMASSIADLGAYQTQAASGRQYAVNTANNRFASNDQKIQQQNMDLASRYGAFSQGRIGQLSQHAADQEFTAGQNAASRRVTRDNALLSAETSRENSVRSVKAREKKGKTVPRATALQQQKADAEIKRALGVIKSYKDRPDRQTAAQDLLAGAAAIAPQTILGSDRQPALTRDPATGKTVAAQTPGDPGFEPVNPLWASVGLDLEYDGYLSQRNVDRLHAQGYSVKDLGYPTAKSVSRRIVPGTFSH